MKEIPTKSWNVVRSDGTVVEVTGVDYDAVLDHWGEYDPLMQFDSGDLANLIDVAVERHEAIKDAAYTAGFDKGLQVGSEQ